MIQFTQGNLLLADVDALVNTVNTQGFMGKGIALQFKKAYPANFEAYAQACKEGKVQVGSMFIVPVSLTHSRVKYIINFPTKAHWRGTSQLAYVQEGLRHLVSEVLRLGITSLAVPPLGCGLGGLSWPIVKKLIEEAFTPFPGVDVLVYAPGKTPDAQDMPNTTQCPPLTPLRAAFFTFIDGYMTKSFSVKLSFVEVQKLAYFLQLAGLPLSLSFAKGHYGPYADNLRHVMSACEGHFILGYGDGTNQALAQKITLACAESAKETLAKGPAQEQVAVEKASDLIEGFEDAYSLELLASVHWAATREIQKPTLEDVTLFVQEWTTRKKTLFTEEHIKIAFSHLQAKRCIQ